MTKASTLLTSMKTALIVGLLALMPALFIAPSAHATSHIEDASSLGTNLGTVGGGAGLSQTDLPTLVGSLVGIVLSLLGIVFLILIIWAGFMWMTAGGKPDQLEKAKKMLINAVIGLVLILAAYAISNFVVSSIVGSI